LERRTSPIGKDRVDHGPGGFDDLCNAAALAMVLATGEADDLALWIGAYGDKDPSPAQVAQAQDHTAGGWPGTYVPKHFKHGAF